MSSSPPMISGKPVGVETANGLAPRAGPRSIARTYNLLAGIAQGVNLIESQSLGKLEFIQTIYCDNSSNPNPVTITTNLTFQAVIFPAFSQGYQPLMVPKKAPNLTVQSPGAAAVSFQFLTMAVPSDVWFPWSGGSTGLNYSVNPPAVAANLLITIPPGPRANVQIQNQDVDQIQIWLDDGTGNNLTCVLLEAAGANVGGGSVAINNHTGRIRIYSANATAQIGAYVV